MYAMVVFWRGTSVGGRGGANAVCWYWTELSAVHRSAAWRGVGWSEVRHCACRRFLLRSRQLQSTAVHCHVPQTVWRERAVHYSVRACVCVCVQSRFTCRVVVRRPCTVDPPPSPPDMRDPAGPDRARVGGRPARSARCPPGVTAPDEWLTGDAEADTAITPRRDIIDDAAFVIFLLRARQTRLMWSPAGRLIATRSSRQRVILHQAGYRQPQTHTAKNWLQDICSLNLTLTKSLTLNCNPP